MRKFLITLMSIGMAGGLFARDIENWSSTRNGTAKITTDDAGTATLEIDAMTIGTLAGIIKGTAGVMSAASAGTDYNGPASYPVYTPTASADVTSNAFVVAAIAQKTIVLKSLGEAFTVVLPNASAVGQELRVQCSSAATTNAIIIADSGNVECGSDWTGGVNDVIEFWSQDGTNWICTGTKDND